VKCRCPGSGAGIYSIDNTIRRVKAGPEEGHENDLRARIPLLQRKAERFGVVQLGEEKAPGRLYCGLPILKESL